MTPNQKRVADRFLELDGDWNQAYRDTHPHSIHEYQNVRRQVYDIKRKPAVLAYITRKLAEGGSAEKAFKIHDEAMGAVLRSKEGCALRDEDGEHIPDHNTRLKAAKEVLSLFTLALKTKEEMTPRQQKDVIDLEAVSTEELRSILANHGQIPATTGEPASRSEDEAGG